MKVSQQMQNLAVQAKRVENQASSLQQQMQQLNNKINMIESTREGIDELIQKDDQEVITPIGDDVYVQSKIRNSKKMLVNVGSGVVVEKKPSEATNILGDRKDMLIEARKKYQVQLQKLQKQYQNLVGQMQKMRQGE